MRKNLLFIFLIFLLIPIFPSTRELSTNEINSLRNLLYSGIERESALDSLKNIIVDLETKDGLKSNPLLIAYKGVSKSVEAKYDFWPWDKFSAVNDGLELLNNSVNLDSTNIEIRFLRFAVLNNIPSIMGYSSEAKSDAEYLYKLITDLNNPKDKYLIEKVVEYLVNSERLDEQKSNVLVKIYNPSLKE